MSSPRIDRQLLDAAVGMLPDDALAPLRREAAERFARLGFPTVGDEDWKYTSLADAAAFCNEWLKSPAAASRDGASEPVELNAARDVDACWIVVRDGIVQPFHDVPDGISVGTLADSGTGIDYEQPLSAFNAALLRDGLHIEIAANARPSKPLGIVFADSPSSAVSQTRVIVDAGHGSHFELVEYSLSALPGRQLTNAVCELRLAEGACIEHVRVQARDPQHTGISRITATLGKDAAFHHGSFDFGGALTRNDVVADIVGHGADVRLDGLYLASGDQHIDNHTSIVHRVGPASSTEEYRGILSGRSRCVFNGKVMVSKGADGTDSSQSNHNLLLSERAEIDTKPELEIYADDVKCSHGATVGQLDKAALFYLQSRGIDVENARRILTRAFAAGAFARLAVPACHDWLAALLERRLESLVGDGR